MNANDIIISPILSEKTNAIRESEVKKYTFRVHPDANKHQIIDAVNELFGVKPVACNTICVKGKPKNTRSKGGWKAGSRPDWKKAMVTMKKGEKISSLEVM